MTDEMCRQCHALRIDRPKSETLCIWCRTGEIIKAKKASPPPPKSGQVAEYAVFDDEGRRVCPDCSAVLVKKDPRGRGRYPKRCPQCAKRAA